MNRKPTSNTITAPSFEGVSDSVIALFGCDQWLMTDVGFDQIKSAMATVKVGDAVKVKTSATKENTIGVIPVSGPIAYRDNWISELLGWSTVTGIQRQLKAFDKDDEVSEVKMLFDTPGGVVTGAPETSLIIANYSKPINAFTDSFCASLGYWYASQCNSISTTQFAMLGSIGAVMGYNKRDEEDAQVFSKNAKHKQGSKESATALVDEIEAMFIETVAVGRGVSTEEVIDNFGQGAVFTGIKAVEVGMADTITTLDEFIAGDSNPLAQSAIPSSSTGAKQAMSNDKNEAGGIPVNEHAKAVTDAREAGKADAIASNADAVTTARAEAAKAERERISEITEAGAGKKPEVVQKFIEDGTDSAQAVSLLELMDDDKPESGLSDRMKDTNAKVTDSGGSPNEDDDEESNQAKADVAGWDDVYKRGAV